MNSVCNVVYQQLVGECCSRILLFAGVTVDPHRRQLHITMAHQYLPEHHASLEELARSKVDPQTPAKWELRLFSRDSRSAASEVSI